MRVPPSNSRGLSALGISSEDEEKQQHFCHCSSPFYSAACVGALLSVALFGCIFSMVRILAIIAFTRLFFHTHKTQLYPILLKLNFPTLRLASEFESIIRQLLKLSHYIVHGKLRIPYVFLNTSCPHGTDSLLTVYILGCILDSLKTFFIPPFSVSYYIILVHFFIIYPPDCF